MFRMIKRKPAECWLLRWESDISSSPKLYARWTSYSSRHLKSVSCCKCQDKIDNKQQLFPKAKSENWGTWPQFSWVSILCFSHCKILLTAISTCSFLSARCDHYLLFIVKLVTSVPSIGQHLLLKSITKTRKYRLSYLCYISTYPSLQRETLYRFRHRLSCTSQ